MSQPLSDYPVVMDIDVAWGEMDAFQHVNNVVYFQYFESVRIRYFEEISGGGAIDEGGVGPILGSTSCRFRAPLTYPDHLKVGARVSEVGTDRFTMEYVVFSERLGLVAATGEGVIVAFDYQKQTKATLPEAWRQRIDATEAMTQRA